MFKKLLIATAVVLGLIYATGHDLASIKRSALGTADEGARSLTGTSDDGWGEGSGY